MRAALSLALRTLVREGRSGDLAVLFLALFVAVAALTGVGFLVDRIERAVQLQANEVLGADIRLQSQSPIESRYQDRADELGLRASRVTSMLSVILKGDHTQLANVNAVAPNYPLRGQVQVAAEAFGEPILVTGIPASGEVWPDSRLLAALDARVGDRISIGATELLVTRVLVSRPDQGSGFVDLAPSLLFNEADLPATQLILPGSRVEYAALFAGERRQVSQFNIWWINAKDRAVRLRAVSESSPEVNNAATRAGRFLSLASLVSVLLCAVAIAMTARRYVKRHLDLAAL
jgi:putative ABC transport system permease protein